MCIFFIHMKTKYILYYKKHTKKNDFLQKKKDFRVFSLKNPFLFFIFINERSKSF
jgi:hypothetical protein